MATIEELHELLDEADDYRYKMHTAVSALLKHMPFYVPQWAVDRFLDAWDEFDAKAVSQIGKTRTQVSSAGGPEGLRATAEEWTTVVFPLLTELSAKVSSGALLADDRFTGAAADAYKGTVPQQTVALDQLGALTEPLSTGLVDLAEAIDNWAGAMKVAIVGLLVALAGALAAVVASETVIGGVAGLLTAIAGLVTWGVAVAYASNTQDAALASVKNTWELGLNDWTGFDGRKWPQAVFPQ